MLPLSQLNKSNMLKVLQTILHLLSREAIKLKFLFRFAYTKDEQSKFEPAYRMI